MTIKDEIIRLMQELPEEATAEETIDEAMARLYLLYRIQRGDRQIEKGKEFPTKKLSAGLPNGRGKAAIIE